MIATLGTRTEDLTRSAELRNVMRVILWRNAIRRAPQAWFTIKRAMDVAIGSI